MKQANVCPTEHTDVRTSRIPLGYSDLMTISSSGSRSPRFDPGCNDSRVFKEVETVADFKIPVFPVAV